MNEQLPAPDFNSAQYERPNLNWVCGKAADGDACRIGPDSKGRCRAAWECQPAMEIKPGEKKGRFRCTRPAEYGGPCEAGPLPDGACSRRVPKCVPQRSLRARRRRFTLSVCVITAALLLIGLCGPYRWRIISPGDLSAQHSTATFARMAGKEAQCAVCHRAAQGGITRWMQAGFGAVPGPLDLEELTTRRTAGMTPIDQNCAHCHLAHSFHQPNVVTEHSCSGCHLEHQGAGLMPRPTDANCISCHGEPAVMDAAYQIGKTLPPDSFDYRPARGRLLFHAPRPERGYTKVFQSFAGDHPDFQVIAENLKDPDTLKFNHQLHLSSTSVSALQKRNLACSDCHQPDAAGVYFLKITFARNCASCHSLHFDVRNPDLTLPHGDAAHVHAFLRSLPQQYADYAITKKRLTDPAQVQSFAQQQLADLRADFGPGEELERRVFFSDARRGPVAKTGAAGEMGAAVFPGCAYCHQVSDSENGPPQVTPPVIPDRWLIRASFNHSKHFKTDCATCHQVEHSRATSDILLPSRRTCVQCHSPKGGVASSCSTCHGFHSPRRDMMAMP